jgi:hypothetical protein
VGCVCLCVKWCLRTILGCVHMQVLLPSERDSAAKTFMLHRSSVAELDPDSMEVEEAEKKGKGMVAALSRVFHRFSIKKSSSPDGRGCSFPPPPPPFQLSVPVVSLRCRHSPPPPRSTPPLLLAIASVMFPMRSPKSPTP